MPTSPSPSSEVADEEVLSWLRLLGSRLEARFLNVLLQHYGTPDEIRAASDEELGRKAALDAYRLRQLRAGPPPGELRNQLAAFRRHGMRLIPATAPDFPRNLFRMRTPPPAIFVKGTLAEEDALAVGIVGPREPTSYGTDVTKALCRDFAPTMTVVSGAAMGIDSVAHEEVLNHGGRTLAVLGCGIDVNYPARNEKLRERIVEEGSAILSVFSPGTPPRPGNFHSRNHVLAGLSSAVIVVEASRKSGALVTARAAAEEGRQVFAVPGDINRRNSQGSNDLLRDGAALCTGAEDVLRELEGMLSAEVEILSRRQRMRSLKQSGKAKARPEDTEDSSAAVSDDSLERFVMERIGHSTIGFDDLAHLAEQRGHGIGALSEVLLVLELDGRIRQEPGRLYSLAL